MRFFKAEKDEVNPSYISKYGYQGPQCLTIKDDNYDYTADTDGSKALGKELEFRPCYVMYKEEELKVLFKDAAKKQSREHWAAR